MNGDRIYLMVLVCFAFLHSIPFLFYWPSKYDKNEIFSEKKRKIGKILSYFVAFLSIVAGIIASCAVVFWNYIP